MLTACNLQVFVSKGSGLLPPRISVQAQQRKSV